MPLYIWSMSCWKKVWMTFLLILNAAVTRPDSGVQASGTRVTILGISNFSRLDLMPWMLILFRTALNKKYCWRCGCWCYWGIPGQCHYPGRGCCSLSMSCPAPGPASPGRSWWGPSRPRCRTKNMMVLSILSNDELWIWILSVIISHEYEYWDSNVCTQLVRDSRKD